MNGVANLSRTVDVYAVQLGTSSAELRMPSAGMRYSADKRIKVSHFEVSDLNQPFSVKD